jgi:hypothetical protein
MNNFIISHFFTKRNLYVEIFSAGPPGLEPGTYELTARRSAN